MKIQFDCVYERDMDMLFMRKLVQDEAFVRQFFLEKEELREKGYDKAEFSVEEVAHSVATEDGESDLEAKLSIRGKKVALLIENKIDARAMPEQAARYRVRGQKAVAQGLYDEFYVFIVAPKDYLDNNNEAKKYPYSVSYEDILASMEDEYEKAMIDHALSHANNVRLPRNAAVTAFWDQLYDFLDEHYDNVFNVHGHKGLERSGQAGQWISISCGKPFSIQIKSDRGFVDLEISGYADRFTQFSNDNRALIDDRQLYVRAASKSLAIRKYIGTIDFTQPFESQIPALTVAFDAAKDLQDLIPKLQVR